MWVILSFLILISLDFNLSMSHIPIHTTLHIGNVKVGNSETATMVLDGSDREQLGLVQTESIGLVSVIIGIDNLTALAEWQGSLKYLLVKEMNVHVLGGARNHIHLEKYQNKEDYPVSFVYSDIPNIIMGACPRSNVQVTTPGLWLNGSKCGDQLNGQHMTVSVVGIAPFVIYTPTGILGCDIDLLNIISSKLNFTFSLKYERYWFAMINGTSQGSFASVDRGESDIGIGCITPDLYVDGPQVDVDTSTHLYSMDVIYVGPKPQAISPRWNFIKPYVLNTWIPILGTIIIVLTFVAMTRILDTVAIIALLFSQSTKYYYQSKLSASERIIFFSWVVFVFIITSSYECNLRAYLMVVDFEKAVDTASDILEQGRHLYVPLGTGYSNHMAEHPIKVYREIIKKTLEGKYQFTFEAGSVSENLDLTVEKQGALILMPRELAYSEFASMAQRRNGVLPYRVSKEVYTRAYVRFLFKKRLPWNPTLTLALSWCRNI